MRLDKYLADCALGTRSEVKKIIRGKRLSVNGDIVTDAGFNVREGDIVKLDGEKLTYEEFEYYMLCKPQGVISQSRKNSLKRGEKAFFEESDEGCTSVVDLITTSGKIDLFPCGRLDKDTEGLLLITNDGQLAHMLLSPKHHVEKTYYAELSGEISDEAIRHLKKGVDIGDDKPTLPCRVERVSESSIRISITEGRYHQIKRMAEAVGLKVTYLKRLSFGSLTLDETLEPRDFRRLTGDELKALKILAYGAEAEKNSAKEKIGDKTKANKEAIAPKEKTTASSDASPKKSKIRGGHLRDMINYSDRF